MLSEGSHALTFLLCLPIPPASTSGLELEGWSWDTLVLSLCNLSTMPLETSKLSTCSGKLSLRYAQKRKKPNTYIQILWVLR